MPDEVSGRLSTLFDTSSAQEMTKCLSQLCNSVSLSTIKVPRFDSFTDVFEFLREFELVTMGLEDSQRTKLLSKAFHAGSNRSWYETDLKPLIEVNRSWPDVRKVIVSRFSESSENERHFNRVRELKFDPDGNKSLLGFVEDLIYSFNRSFGVQDQTLAVKYIKASIPSEIKPAMNSYSEFRDASTINMVKQAARQYDMTRGSTTKQNASREATKELASIIQDLVKSIKKENDDTRKAVVNAFKTFETTALKEPPTRQSSSNQTYYRANSPQPRDQYYQPRTSFSDNRYKRPMSPAREENARDRGRSPQRYDRYVSSDRPKSPNLSRPTSPGYKPEYRHYKPVSERPSTPRVKEEDTGKQEEPDEAFNSRMYFARFGKPPAPCGQCKAWHWNKHCPFYLN